MPHQPSVVFSLCRLPSVAIGKGSDRAITKARIAAAARPAASPVAVGKPQAGCGTARNSHEIAGAFRDAVIVREGGAEGESAGRDVVEQPVGDSNYCTLQCGKRDVVVVFVFGSHWSSGILQIQRLV
jgi:hypothetical protein